MEIIRTHSTNTSDDLSVVNVVLIDHGDDATPRFSVAIRNEGEITKEQTHATFDAALADFHARVQASNKP